MVIIDPGADPLDPTRLDIEIDLHWIKMARRRVAALAEWLAIEIELHQRGEESAELGRRERQATELALATEVAYLGEEILTLDAGAGDRTTSQLGPRFGQLCIYRLLSLID